MASNLPEILTAWLQSRMPTATDIRVDGLGGASSGLSAETLLFTLNYRDPEQRSERLVLRSGPKHRGIFPDYDLGLQAGVMRALETTDLPTPVVRWFEPSAEVTGAPFIVMNFIAGEVPSDNAPGFHGQGLYANASEAQRKAMWSEGLRKVAELHALDWRALDLPALPGAAADPKASMASQGRLLEDWIRWGEMDHLKPIQDGMKWLRDTPPPETRLSLLWGDARPGNILHQEGRPAGMLDWEIASVGPPGLDLFYWWWSSELLAEVNQLPRLPGLPDHDETVRIYEQHAGKPLDGREYTETFAVLRLAIMGVLGVRAAVSAEYSEDYILNNGAMRTLAAIMR